MVATQTMFEIACLADVSFPFSSERARLGWAKRERSEWRGQGKSYTILHQGAHFSNDEQGSSSIGAVSATRCMYLRSIVNLVTWT